MSSYYRLLSRLQGIRLQFKGLGFYLIALIILSCVIGACFYRQFIIFDAPKITKNMKEINNLVIDLKTCSAKLASKNMELKLANEMNKNMQQMFAEQIKAKQEAERELAFYRSIMTPEAFANGAVIHGAELEHGLARNQFRLKLVLTQMKKLKKPIKGHINISLIGSRAGNPYKMGLSELIEDRLKFSYRYFEVIETDFILPDDFKLDRLIVEVIVPKTRWHKRARARQTFNISELLNEKDKRVLLEQTTQVTDNRPQQMM